MQALLASEEDGAGEEVPQRQAILSALNGVLGDHLARTGNPLAIGMELVVRGAARPRLLLLVHGLCMNDTQWTRDGHDHGLALAKSLDCTPVYVRYNSGRHVCENAAELATRLQELVAHWPVAVEDLAIVGHSMGGLVARSAVHQASEAGMAWPRQLRQMVFLGTPHHGAALERAGNWLHTVLGLSPYLAPFTRLGRLRSDGITDLRHGNLLESDWQGAASCTATPALWSRCPSTSPATRWPAPWARAAPTRRWATGWCPSTAPWAAIPAHPQPALSRLAHLGGARCPSPRLAGQRGRLPQVARVAVLSRVR